MMIYVLIHVDTYRHIQSTLDLLASDHLFSVQHIV